MTSPIRIRVPSPARIKSASGAPLQVKALPIGMPGARGEGAAEAMAAHEAAADPHPQYATDTALTAALTGKENTGVAAGLVSTHAARTDNPHGVTAGQVGAPTISDLAAESTARAAHSARTDNPHAVSAAQVGAATLAALQDEITARTTADTAKADKVSTYTKTETDTLVANAIAALVNGAPGALDTLKELADALADDDTAIAALTAAIAGKEASGTAAAAIATHEAAADPHSQYLLQSEGDTRADLRIAAAIGSTVQAYSANLASLAGQASQAFGRSVLNLANEAGLTALLNTFTSSLKGLVPASGGGTINFLRADGSFADPRGLSYGTLSADRTLANNTSLQAIFESGSDEFAVEAGCIYEFRLTVAMSAMSATSGNVSFSLLGAGTAVLTGGRGQIVGQDASVAGTAGAQGGIYTGTAVSTSGNVVTAGTSTSVFFTVEGTFITNAAGTIIPSVAQTNAAAAVVDRYSMLTMRRLGPSSQLSLGAS